MRKRILAIALCLVMPLTTVGVTAASAMEVRQAGKSSVYHVDNILIGDAGVGKLTVNFKQLTFVFNGNGGEPGTTQYLHFLLLS